MICIIENIIIKKHYKLLKKTMEKGKLEKSYSKFSIRSNRSAQETVDLSKFSDCQIDGKPFSVHDDGLSFIKESYFIKNRAQGSVSCI